MTERGAWASQYAKVCLTTLARTTQRRALHTGKPLQGLKRALKNQSHAETGGHPVMPPELGNSCANPGHCQGNHLSFKAKPLP